MADPPLHTTRVKLLTVIAEAVLEDRLIRDVKRLGARGFTRSAVTGEGSRGRRVGDVEGANVRLECLVSEEVAERILAELSASYFEHYAAVAFVEDVSVVRGEKYI
ncbi:MAG: transcriptional regulator [Myxococcota bacterium]|nr:transcriptional regulator [Myxococcota bacterium]